MVVAETILQDIHTKLLTVSGYSIFRNNINILNEDSEIPAILLQFKGAEYDQEYLDSPHVHWIMRFTISTILKARTSTEQEQLTLSGVLHETLMTDRNIMDGTFLYYQGFTMVEDEDAGSSNFSVFEHNYTVDYHTTALNLET